MFSSPQTSGICRRCGECCRKSSPTLHRSDRDLFVSGVVSFRQVYTLRRGELAYDTIRGELTALEGELIKLRESANPRRCVFLQPGSAGCAIYASRPIQCSTLECWNPEPLVRLFATEKLRRADVINDSLVQELIDAHEERISLPVFAAVIRAYEQGDSDGKEILDLLNYDLFFRDFVAEKTAVDRETFPFLFGRPLIETISGFGYALMGDRQRGFTIRQKSNP